MAQLLNSNLSFQKYRRKFGAPPQPLRKCTPELFANTQVSTGAKRDGDGNWTSVRINNNNLFSFGSIAHPLIACGPPKVQKAMKAAWDFKKGDWKRECKDKEAKQKIVEG